MTTTQYTVVVSGSGSLGFVLNVDVATCLGVIASTSQEGALERENPGVVKPGDALTAINGDAFVPMTGFDTDGDGCIDRDELISSLEDEGSTLRDTWIDAHGGEDDGNEKIADAILDYYDADGNGELNDDEVSEFLQLMLNSIVAKVAESSRPMTLEFSRTIAAARPAPMPTPQQRMAMSQMQQLQQQQQQQQLASQSHARQGADEKAATLAFVEDFRKVKKQLEREKVERGRLQQQVVDLKRASGEANEELLLDCLVDEVSGRMGRTDDDVPVRADDLWLELFDAGAPWPHYQHAASGRTTWEAPTGAAVIVAVTDLQAAHRAARAAASHSSRAEYDWSTPSAESDGQGGARGASAAVLRPGGRTTGMERLSAQLADVKEQLKRVTLGAPGGGGASNSSGSGSRAGHPSLAEMGEVQLRCALFEAEVEKLKERLAAQEEERRAAIDDAVDARLVTLKSAAMSAIAQLKEQHSASLQAFMASAKADRDVHAVVVQGLEAQLGQATRRCEELRNPRDAAAQRALAQEAVELRSRASALLRGEEAAVAGQQQLTAVNAFLRKRVAALEAEASGSAARLEAAERRADEAERGAERSASALGERSAELRAQSARVVALEQREAVEARAASLFEQRREEHERKQLERRRRDDAHQARLQESMVQEQRAAAIAAATAVADAQRSHELEVDLDAADAAFSELDELRSAMSALDGM